jgi:cell division protein FtsI/penicillin-binding protein 2
VTAIQLLGAISAIANNGVYMKPFVVKYVKDIHDQMIKETKPEIVDKVISIQTALRVKSILQGVVERGTGTKAQIKGVTVAGKTGTAQKVVDGRYSHGHFYASFIGFAPVNKRSYF